MRGWAWAGLVAQVVFVLGWGLAAAWQPAGYSVLAHSISDMYAVTAPHAWFLVVLLTLCGAATVGFAWFSVRPVLRPAGRRATVTAVLLTLSIFGLGDLLSPFEQEACQAADAGCAATGQAVDLGGLLDSILSTVGLLAFAVGGFVLASALRRLPSWSRWAGVARGLTIAFVVAFLATGFLGGLLGLGGLFERLLAFVGALGLALLAWAILVQTAVPPARRTSPG